MEGLIIQIGNHNHRFSNVEQLSGNQLTIGRGFSNDIILTDPYVAPFQLKITSEENCWTLENLDNTNPVLLNKKELENSETSVYSGDEITVGRTTLKLFSKSHEVAKTREFTFTNWLHAHRFKPAIAFVMLTATFLLSILLQALTTFEKIDWGDLSSNAIIIPIIVVIWSGCWSLTGSFLRHHHYFFSHLFFSSISALIILVWSNTYGYIEYITSNTNIAEIIDWIMAITVIGIAIGFNLNLSTNSSHTFIKGIISSTCILSLMALTYYLAQDDFNNKPVYMTSVKPPFVITRKAVTPEKHINQYKDIFEDLAQFEKPE